MNIEGGLGAAILSDAVAPEPKKPGMSEEHKAKMAAGRERARQEGRMGRRYPPSDSAPTPSPAPAPQPTSNSSGEPSLDDLERAVEALESGAVRVTRQPRGTTDTTFDVPEAGKRPGWDYCWWPFKVIGEEVDPSAMVEIAQGGWVPVPVSHFRALVPVGWKRPTIERQGQRLYMRPMRLSEEAKEETYKQAFEQKEAQVRQQLTGDSGREIAPRDPRAGGLRAKMEPLL